MSLHRRFIISWIRYLCRFIVCHLTRFEEFQCVLQSCAGSLCIGHNLFYGESRRGRIQLLEKMSAKAKSMLSVVTNVSTFTLLDLNSNAWATWLVISFVCVEFLSKRETNGIRKGNQILKQMRSLNKNHMKGTSSELSLFPL